MSDGFYAGWGIRDEIAGSLKQLWNDQSNSSNRRALEFNCKAVARARHQLSLDQEHSLAALGQLIAEGVLRRFLREEQEIEREAILALPFHQHLSLIIAQVLEFEQPFSLPSQDALKRSGSTSDLWAAEDQLRAVSKRLEHFTTYCSNFEHAFKIIVEPMIAHNPSLLEFGHQPWNGISFRSRLIDTLNDLPTAVERVIEILFAPDFDRLLQTQNLQERLEYNVSIASGGYPGEKLPHKSMKMPTQNAGKMQPVELIISYLEGTPLLDLFDYTVSIPLPQSTRFEHHHIVAGSGHGKTQTLQYLIAHDLPAVATGNASVVVIDSQGDLIKNIANLDVFAEGGSLEGRLVLIDPTDVEYPVALNLFDIGMERINQYSQLDRERMVNGVLELYDFVLGSLLDAQMTQKQSVIFRYITRLMLHIPNATIETLRDLLEDGGSERYHKDIESLQGSARAFFKTEFDSREFVQTKKQVLRRLWGILENQSFERMFLHPKNKLDLFSELNNGKVILINTAKDLLKEEGTQIFGRFFIAMIAQAAQERSVIDADMRMPTYVYVDEAQDYFDRNVGIILSQARKYKVGMVLAHQFLGQLDSKLQEGVFANTSIKFAGGVSAKDARSLAGEMRTSAEFIEERNPLEFAAFIRGATKQAIALSVEPGILENMDRMTAFEFAELQSNMRDRYAVHYSQLHQQADETFEFEPATDQASEASVNTNRGNDSTATMAQRNNTEGRVNKPSSGTSSESDGTLSTEPSDWN